MPAHRTNFVCIVDGCSAPAFSVQLCRAHYARKVRHGNPLAGGPRQGRPLSERLDRYIRRTDECWWWTGSRDRLGYGRLSVAGRPELAHRLTYGQVRGSVPHGLELDHLCRHPGCVRPDHLEAVTHAENLRRGVAARQEAA